MSHESSATLANSGIVNGNLGNTLRSALNNPNAQSGVSVKYARLQGYLEGYLDQMSASKDTQEELISKILSELGEILNPLAGSNNDDR